MKPTWCLLLFFIFIVKFYCYGLKHERDENYECIQLWLQKKPDLLARFHRNQISWLCNRTDTWIRISSTPSRPVTDFLTTKQKEYLNDLQCQGWDCLKVINISTHQNVTPIPIWVPLLIGGKKKGPSDALSPTDTFDSIDENALSNENPEKCQERFWISRTCKFLINDLSVEEVFPEEFQNGHRVSLETRRKMQERLENRKSKCTKIKKFLILINKTFDDFPNCQNVVVFLTPKELIEICEGILENENSWTKSIWNFFKKLTNKMNVNIEKYGDWLEKCRRIRDRLGNKGMNFQEWLKSLTQKLNGKRRKRALEIIDHLRSDFGDILIENSIDHRAKRKEYRMLSDQERNRYHQAINRLKHEKIDNLSKYDLLVIYHTPQEAPEAHCYHKVIIKFRIQNLFAGATDPRGPAFLPFHREFLKQYELALRKIDPDVSLPYWDSTLDEGLPVPSDSIIWSREFLGTKDGPVTEGPFANWESNQELAAIPGMRKLYRNVGQSSIGGLYKTSDIDFIMNKQKYDDLTACVDPTFELVHGVVHMFVGGYMEDIAISPNDPAFFMHHNFIDYLWEEFRQSKQTPQQRENDYPNSEKTCNDFHHSDAQMKPFSIKNIDGLSNNYTNYIYFYQPRPTCSNFTHDCGSHYLFCNIANSRCLSKIRLGGNCTGFENLDICYNSTCKNGLCVKVDQPITSTDQPITSTDQSITSTDHSITSTDQPITSTKQPLTTTTAEVMITSTLTASTSHTTAVTITPMATMTTSSVTGARMNITTSTTRSNSMTTIINPYSTGSSSQTYGQSTTRSVLFITTSKLNTTVSTTKPLATTTISKTTNATETPSSSPIFPIAYFTVTILRGQGYYAQPMKNIQVKTIGLNSPLGYTQTLPGIVMFPNTSYPSYPGACILKTYNPTNLSSYLNVVQFSIEVIDGNGNRCHVQCFDQVSKRYGHCPRGNKFKISPNSHFSDPIKYGNDEKEALEKSWIISGYSRQRTTDYIMFQC